VPGSWREGLVGDAVLPGTAEAQDAAGRHAAGAGQQGRTLPRRAGRRHADDAAGRREHHARPAVRDRGLQRRLHGRQRDGARNALPNTSIQTVQEVIDYEAQVIANTELPIVADGENGGGSPVTTYRTVQQLERAGAAVIMLEDSTGPESEYGGKGVAMATREVMIGRIKAAVDARRMRA
jgi:hypothetical protein